MNYLKETEWNNLKIAIDGKPVTGVRNVTYKETSEDEALYGAGRNPISIQTGNKSYDGSIKLLKNEADALNAAALLLGYDSIVDVPGVTIVAAYLPEAGRLLRTDILQGCKISEYGNNMEQGAKMMEIELPFKFLSIKRG